MVSEDLGLKLENVTEDMLGTSKKVKLKGGDCGVGVNWMGGWRDETNGRSIEV